MWLVGWTWRFTREVDLEVDAVFDTRDQADR
jgi:hypothetical protein